MSRSCLCDNCLNKLIAKMIKNAIAALNIKDGKSAYAIAVEYGYVGTVEEWLADLVGPQGPQGPQGEQGPAGPAGSQIVGLQMQATTSAGIITDTAIMFDSVVFDNANGAIIFDIGNSNFILTGPAVYKVDWQVSHAGSEETNNITIALMHGNNLILSCNPVVAGQTSGSALINSSQPIDTLSLVPQDQAILLTNMAVQANIVITKIS